MADRQRISGRVLGVMSGTSLDGLDLALCDFHDVYAGKFDVIKAFTVSFPPELLAQLHDADLLRSEDLLFLDNELGRFIANQVNKNFEGEFIIASHGHTIFHQPERRMTLQVGSPAIVAAHTGRTVVGDFRRVDVALGGQGAPLVPVGDHLLFSEYSSCLNLGGIANSSCIQDGYRVAGDSSPCNIVLNKLAKVMGFAFDHGGDIARSGKLNASLLNTLDSLDFYAKPFPKSLSREWIERKIFPCLQDSGLGVADQMHTSVEHFAHQIGKRLPAGECLVTGGGTWNSFLIERIQHHSEAQLVIPSRELVNFKEAIVFALLGLLRMHEKINIYSSVTGSSRDHSAGAIYIH